MGILSFLIIHIYARSTWIFRFVPLHWHDELELIYIKKGMGRITVDFREYKVKGPTLALILPGQLHSIDQLEDASWNMKISSLIRVC